MSVVFSRDTNVTRNTHHVKQPHKNDDKKRQVNASIWSQSSEGMKNIILYLNVVKPKNVYSLCMGALLLLVSKISLPHSEKWATGQCTVVPNFQACQQMHDHLITVEVILRLTRLIQLV